MRLPRPLAWLILGLTFFTAGLLRQFHDETPYSPFVPPLVGSLLFAAVFFLLLVAARERRLGAVPGPGIRLGNLTPLLLMLLLEKWVSIGLYNPAFHLLVPQAASAAALDAQYRAFAGLGLLLVCLLVAQFSPPTARRTWLRVHPAGWPIAILGTAAVLAGTYLLACVAAALLGRGLHVRWPAATGLTLWILGGQGLRSFSEEVYYRGLILSEMHRLAPRLGARSLIARRWAALAPMALLFGMEHMTLSAPWGEMGRQWLFTFSLGLLLGLLVIATGSLVFATGVHAWINWLLLGAAPRLDDAAGHPALPAGAYVGVALALAFTLAFLVRKGAGADA